DHLDLAPLAHALTYSRLSDSRTCEPLSISSPLFRHSPAVSGSSLCIGARPERGLGGRASEQTPTHNRTRLRFTAMKHLRNLLVPGLPAPALGVSAIPASAQTRVSAGTLSCGVAPGVSFVFGSTRQVNCIYYGTNGVAERYLGEIDR